MHIASTLDLRKNNPTLAEAALKSIVLDKSSDVFGESVRKIGIYAVHRELRDQYKQNIELLSDYADETFNWLDSTQQKRFLERMYQALPAPFFEPN